MPTKFRDKVAVRKLRRPAAFLNNRVYPSTRVRESGGFELENLFRVPGDAWRTAKEAL